MLAIRFINKILRRGAARPTAACGRGETTTCSNNFSALRIEARGASTEGPANGDSLAHERVASRRGLNRPRNRGLVDRFSLMSEPLPILAKNSIQSPWISRSAPVKSPTPAMPAAFLFRRLQSLRTKASIESWVCPIARSTLTGGARQAMAADRPEPPDLIRPWMGLRKPSQLRLG